MSAAEPKEQLPSKEATLLLAGDVMTGRGLDQVLPHPGDARLYEDFIKDARDYVGLAQEAHGTIAAPVSFAYPWGDALEAVERHRPDLRLVNLETAITVHPSPEPKAVAYRMHPDNGPVLSAFGIDGCSLANNHSLDWGVRGLEETLKTLERLGIESAGAGCDLAEAAGPAIFPIAEGRRVLFFAFASPTSGVPASWAAEAERPGINLASEANPETTARIAKQVASWKRTGDIVVLSIHWGGNWGYEISPEQVSVAHGLIDQGGADLVFGHSSHHAKGIEVYKGKLILYGCGDALNDYEGIPGYEQYRDDLALFYLPVLRWRDGRLSRLTVLAFQIRNLRLNRCSPNDLAWVADRLNREGHRFGTRLALTNGDLALRWG